MTKPDLRRLSLPENQIEPLTTIPPWTAVCSQHVARAVHSHVQTLKLWIRAGNGPQPIIPGSIEKARYWLYVNTPKTTGHFFLLGEIHRWWQSMMLPPEGAQSYSEICRGYRASTLGELVLAAHPALETDDPETCPNEESILRYRRYLALN